MATLFLGLLGTLPAQDINDFYFKEAQPKKEDELTRFPTSIRGLYKSDKDTTRRLRITADTVCFEVPMVQFAPLAELHQKNYTVTDSTIASPEGKLLFSFIKNDTVFFVDYVQSVLFCRGDKQVIKKVNESYVLSKEIAPEMWECTLINVEQDKISVAYFDMDGKEKEIANNRKIQQENKEGKTFYLTNLKKKEFIKIMDQNFFPRKQFFSKRFNWQ